MSRFEMNTETRQVLDFLLKKPKEFTYSELMALTGVNDISRVRGYLMTSLRRLRKQGVWYSSVRGVGYRLLVEDEKNGDQTKSLTRIRRKVKRTDKDQDNIYVEALSRDGKLAFTFNSAKIGRLKEALSRTVSKEIERKIANGDLPLLDKKSRSPP